MAFAQLLSFIGLHTDFTKPAPGLKWRSHTVFIVATVGMGLFTDLFLYALVVPVIPFLLEDRLGLQPEDQQTYVSAILTVYAGSSVVFSFAAGFIADKTSSRQLPFLVGLVLLFFGCLGVYIGQSFLALALARVLQGMSAAVVWTVGLALCMDTVGPENLGKTIGTIFSFTAFGSLAAPVIGGVLYQKAGYKAVFYLSVGLLVFDFVMRLLVIEKKVAAKYEAAAGLQREESNGTAHQNGNGRHPNQGDDEEQPLLGTKILDEYRISPDQPWIIRQSPILYCFRNKSLLAALLVAFVQAALLGVIDSTIPTHAEETLGFNSLQAGLLFLPLGSIDAMLGPVAGWTVDKYGTKPPAVFGYSFMVPVLIALRAIDHNSRDQLILYCVLLALMGVGMAVISAPSIVEAGKVVQKYYEANPKFFGENGPYAQLYGCNSAMFNLGLTLGPLAAGALKDAVGYGNMNAVVAGLCVVTATVSFFFLGGPPSQYLSSRKKKSFTG